MTGFRLVLLESDGPVRSEVAAVIRDATALPSLLLEQCDTLPALIQTLNTRNDPYDLAVVSLDLSPDGPEVHVRALKARFPMTSFVVYSTSDNLKTTQRAYAAGAAGFFRRDSPLELIKQVLHVVLGGEAFAIPDHLRPECLAG